MCPSPLQSLCMTMALRQSRLKWLNPLLRPRRHAERKPTPVPATRPHPEQYTPATMGRYVWLHYGTLIPSGRHFNTTISAVLFCLIKSNANLSATTLFCGPCDVLCLFSSPSSFFFFFCTLTFILQGCITHLNVNKTVPPKHYNSKCRTERCRHSTTDWWAFNIVQWCC